MAVSPHIPWTAADPPTVTFAQKYEHAMLIGDQAEADAYFETCVQHTMRFGHSRPEAEDIERSNLGYWAGYYDNETRLRVERLFRCEHPVFGKLADRAHRAPSEI